MWHGSDSSSSLLCKRLELPRNSSCCCCASQCEQWLDALSRFPPISTKKEAGLFPQHLPTSTTATKEKTTKIKAGTVTYSRSKPSSHDSHMLLHVEHACSLCGDQFLHWVLQLAGHWWSSGWILKFEIESFEADENGANYGDHETFWKQSFGKKQKFRCGRRGHWQNWRSRTSSCDF